jgi:hypothetical protein
MRVARDTAVARYNKGEISRAEVPSLPVNLRWARSQNKAGQPDSSKPFSHSRKGYRMVTAKDVGTDWLKELPPGTIQNADGTLRNGDSVLMVCSAKDAARNEYNRNRTTDERLNGLTDTLTQNLEQQGVKTYKGADTQVVKMSEGAKLFDKGKN